MVEVLQLTNELVIMIATPWNVFLWEHKKIEIMVVSSNWSEYNYMKSYTFRIYPRITIVKS
jgi:hypothetical protein